MNVKKIIQIKNRIKSKTVSKRGRKGEIKDKKKEREMKQKVK